MIGCYEHGLFVVDEHLGVAWKHEFRELMVPPLVEESTLRYQENHKDVLVQLVPSFTVKERAFTK